MSAKIQLQRSLHLWRKGRTGGRTRILAPSSVAMGRVEGRVCVGHYTEHDQTAMF